MKCFPRTPLKLLLFSLVAAVPIKAIAADALPEEISSRLEPKWVAAAKQIRMPGRVVYYHGSAKGKMAADGKHWIGKIDGEILFLTPKYAMACLDMRLAADGSMNIQGTSESKIIERDAPWAKLVAPK